MAERGRAANRTGRRVTGQSPRGDVVLRIFTLADHAAVSPGDAKVYINGANIGWQALATIPGNLSPLYLVVLISFPWSRAAEPHQLLIRLLDSDRRPVGPDPLVEGQVEVGRPPGVTAGEELTVPLVLPLGGLRIERDGLIYFHIEIQGQELGILPFRVRSGGIAGINPPAPPPATEI